MHSSNGWRVSALVMAALVTVSRLAAIEGVEDTVIITADFTIPQKWSLEEPKWDAVISNTQMMLQNTQSLVRNTNELLVRLGKTDSAVSRASATIPTSTDSLGVAVGIDSRQKTLSTAAQRYSLNQVPWTDKNNPAYEVSANYEVFGQQQKRDNARYSSFAAQQAMNDRFQKAAENAEQVETEELKVQAEAVKRLQAATTEAEIQVCNLAVESSKGRLDLAHAKMNQAKAEMDEYQVKVGIEKERKAEADREWTESVVSGLRARALKAYTAQGGSGDDKS